MKNTIKLIGIIAVTAVIGFWFTACGGVKTGGDEETESETESETNVIIPECLTHTYGDWNIIANATSDEDGEEKRTCGVCGHAQTKTIPATGNPECLHEYGEWEIKRAATCTDEGEKERTCIMCPKSEIDATEATGHAPLSWKIKPGYRACPNTGCDSAIKVELGDTGPGGGFIYYVKPEGFTVEGFTGAAGSFNSYTAYYLEAAPADIQGTFAWTAGAASTKNINDALTLNIGTGKKNTMAILAIASGNPAELAPAAHACHTYYTSTTSAGDWFLPSRDELEEIFNQYGKGVNFGDLKVASSNDRYWSSTQQREIESYYCYYQNNKGNSSYIGNSFKYNVRAIRAF
ncbi:MAG: DUF1566 domain-containing protein [Treponema sp.]|nr:DUF1566 domain-containing protein [Treponema sp.]